MNNPLATLYDQFLKERTFLKNVTPSMFRWYQVAFKNYRAMLADDVQSVPTKASLQAFVIQQRNRGGDLQHLHRRDECVLPLVSRGTSPH